MKFHKAIILSLLIISLYQTNLLSQEKPTAQYTSLWEGNLKIGSVTLRLVVKLFTKPDGSTGAVLDSPDQGAKDIPVSDVSYTKDSLKIASKTINIRYTGAIIPDSMLIKGIFTQGNMVLPLTLKKIDKLTELNRPQLPKKPFPYTEEDVVIENKTAKITLAGTLTYPNTGGTFPAVVLVTGSGPQDRDETIMQHKPFLVIADYLTRSGIAVLRFDDRGIGKSKGNFAASTTADFATDALACVEYLKTRKEINHSKIGIAGHSEGGLIAPMCAVNSGDVSFIVMIAGPGMTGKEILHLQTALVMRAEGSSEPDIKKAVDMSDSIYNIIVSEPDSSAAVKKLSDFYRSEFNKLSEADKKNPDYSEEGFNQKKNTLMSPWFRFFLKYDPRPALENLNIPVLAINGGNDIQVPPKENLAEIEKALKSGGNTKFKIAELPGLNHLFQHCKTCSVSEYSNIEETFAPEALMLIKDWILGVVK